MEHIDAIMTAVGMGVIAVAWLARLEHMGKTNSRDIEAMNLKIIAMEAKHDALDSRVVNQLTEIKISLAKIEGKLGIEK